MSGSYIVQKPVDSVNLTAKALKYIAETSDFDITPKYDGCCAVLAFDGSGGFVSAYSATGEPAPSMGLIGRWIERTWSKRPLAGIALIGEAWAPGGDFPTISGWFRRKSEQAALRFVPFDAVRWTPGDEYPLLSDDRPFRERVRALSNRSYDPEFVLPMPYRSGDFALASELARQWKAQGGFDGAILRLPEAAYEVGRCKFEVIKIKPTLSLDLVVTDYMTAPGDKTGRPVHTIEVEYRGVRTWVGSGVPHEMPAGFGDAIVADNVIVEVECMGITADGKLREPRFKGVRHDKTGPDA